MRFLIPLFLSWSFLAQSQEKDFSSVLHVNYDNDFFSATDYYYTQGIRFELLSPFENKNPVNFLLLHLKGGSSNSGISINQQCFTPTSIRRDTIFTGDRPFAGALFIGFSRISLNEDGDEMMTSELDAGGVGPCAYCKETQENIHRWLHNIQPLGWQFQVGNAVALNYSLKYERRFFRMNYFDAGAFAEMNAGTLYDGAGVGTNMHLGTPAGLPGHSFRSFTWLLFSTAEIYGVGYNATLEGGVFQKLNPYVIPPGHVERVLMKASYGVILHYRMMSVEYAKFFLSPEFYHGLEHSWGHCNLTFYF